MNQRPILFSTPMVQAILDGRKTMTRRIVNPQPDENKAYRVPRILGQEQIWDHWCWDTKEGERIIKKCLYGEIGDILWVRETFRKYYVTFPDSDRINFDHEIVDYAADPNTAIPMQDGDGFQVFNKDGSERYIPWKPSIHMEKKHCRIYLEITELRVERLNEISESDAVSEGIRDNRGPFQDGIQFKNYLGSGSWTCSPAYSFQTLWAKINGQESWDLNPWVWVIEFKKIDKP
jgi:hypothetical protein